MSYKYILDETCTPVACDDVIAWAQWMSDPARTQLMLDSFSDGPPASPTIQVSTVFLGIDPHFGLSGGPRLFETVIFWDGRRHSEWRSISYAEAAAAHDRATGLANMMMPWLKLPAAVRLHLIEMCCCNCGGLDRRCQCGNDI